jgi:hypothetical protein
MNQQLSAPITSAKLKFVLSYMGKKCSLGPNGLLIEFFLLMWDIRLKVYIDGLQCDLERPSPTRNG